MARPIRYLYQGILKIGVGFYKLRLGNYRGTINHLNGGIAYLEPFGETCLGGVIVDRTQNIALVYGIIGALTILIPLAFFFTPLGHAEDYLPKPEEQAAAPPPSQDQLRQEETPPEIESVVIPS